jgi:uncharacterized phage-associated protein
MAKYSVEEIANYFLHSTKIDNIKMTPLKLMKLVYFAYAWYLYLTDEDLFEDDIKAWKHGPVIERLYNEFRDFKLYGDISDRYAMLASLNDKDLEVMVPYVSQDHLDANLNLKNCLAGVWEFYKKMSSNDVENITHREGSAWTKYYQQDQNVVMNGDEIGKKLIKQGAEIGYRKAIEELTKKGLVRKIK